MPTMPNSAASDHRACRIAPRWSSSCIRPLSTTGWSSRNAAGTTVLAALAPVIRSISGGWISVVRECRLTTIRVSWALRIRSRSHRRSVRLAARTAMTSGVVTSSAVSAISTATALALVICEPQSTTTTSKRARSAVTTCRAARSVTASPCSPSAGPSSSARPLPWVNIASPSTRGDRSVISARSATERRNCTSR